MIRPPKLTDVQRRRLRPLEDRLRVAARTGEYEPAVKLVEEIQGILRPTGHEMRLQEAKARLFEAAMEAGNFGIAEAGFEGIRQKAENTTRLWVEATSLLAISKIRRHRLQEADINIREVFDRTRNISSEKKRKQFFREIVQRFEEEGALSALRGSSSYPLDAKEMETAAGNAQGHTEDQLYADLGRALPAEVTAFIYKVDLMSRGLLTDKEIKYLPPPEELLKPRALGITIFGALKRVLWRSVCDPKSESYKAFIEGGLMSVVTRLIESGR